MLVLAMFLTVAVRQLVLHHGGQQMAIPGDTPTPLVATPRAATPSVDSYQHDFVTTVSADGRYFLDQAGRPLLVRGDSPWSLLTDLSPSQAELWFDNREKNGFNAAIVSLVGSSGNGGPHDDGSTYDGLNPFVNGDVTNWSDAYWVRAHDYLEMAAAHGITIMLYPIDGWTIGHSFVPQTQVQCSEYGVMVASYFADLPNLVWMSGGDYFPHADDPGAGSDVDHCIDAMLRGIRSTGDSRPFSMQLGYPKSISTENPFWAQRVDWNFVYTYNPTYKAVSDAYLRQPPIPALLGEANYEGENNDAESPETTRETLRRQVIWALTSGACGDFMGSDDWEFNEGWESRLDTDAVRQIDRIRDVFASLPWWELRPDGHHRIITRGHGSYLTSGVTMDVLDNDYATAAKTPDGKLGIIYLPTSRGFSVNLGQFAAHAEGRWIDPASGSSIRTNLAEHMTTPGKNSDGDGDWLLLISAS